MRRASKGYSRVVTPLFDTMLVQPQGEAPSTSPLRITSSPSLSSNPTTSSTLTTPPSIQITHEAEKTATMPHDLPLLGGHTPESNEGRMQHTELMELITKLTDKIAALEKDLQQTKKTYSTALTKLVLKVKKLEKQVRSGKAKKRARIVLSKDEDATEDPCEQGKKIAQIDTDPTISLVQDEGTSWFQEDIETQDKNSADTEVLLEEATPTKLIENLGSGEKCEKEISTANVPVSTTSAEVSIASHDVSTAAAALVYIRRSASNAKDKGKAIMYHALQNRPYSVAEVRKNMVMYLKNQAGYKQSYFKGMKYEEIRPIFEKVWDQTHTFVPMDSEDKEKDSEKRGSRKKSLARKRASEKQSEESTKRLKIEDDVEKEELKAYLDLVPREEFSMEIESLATKYPIVDWKTHVLTENFMYYQIFRADGSFKNYKIFSEMLDDFARQDVLDLHRLVKARYMTSSPEGYDLMLWGDPKILFESDEEDEVWRNLHEYNLISWRLFDSCRIHILLMNNGIAIHMLIEKKYSFTQEMLSKMLSRKLEVDHENEMAFELLSVEDSVAPTTIEEITLAQTLIQIKAAKPKVVTTAATTTTTTRPKARGVVVQEPSEFRTPQESQPSMIKDKGKAIMIEPEVPLKRKDQVALDEDLARNLQA
ncbi:hypothetical protein Tco_0991944 [Tanacetum coccineum]|uniref:Uncharacterized protein n=1 Tax=Tanacetum coccineum TaxID=301880 RepID=A0ABQ5F0Y1_9ASTR